MEPNKKSLKGLSRCALLTAPLMRAEQPLSQEGHHQLVHAQQGVKRRDLPTPARGNSVRVLTLLQAVVPLPAVDVHDVA